jgi:hypothetical protein
MAGIAHISRQHMAGALTDGVNSIVAADAITNEA